MCKELREAGSADSQSLNWFKRPGDDEGGAAPPPQGAPPNPLSPFTPPPGAVLEILKPVETPPIETRVSADAETEEAEGEQQGQGEHPTTPPYSGPLSGHPLTNMFQGREHLEEQLRHQGSYKMGDGRYYQFVPTEYGA